jgi:hypothetical protein
VSANERAPNAQELFAHGAHVGQGVGGHAPPLFQLLETHQLIVLKHDPLFQPALWLRL